MQKMLILQGAHVADMEYANKQKKHLFLRSALVHNLYISNQEFILSAYS